METPMEFKVEIVVRIHKENISEEQAIQDIKNVFCNMYDSYLAQSLINIEQDYEAYKANKKELDYKRMIVYYIANFNKITKLDELQRNIQTTTED